MFDQEMQSAECVFRRVHDDLPTAFVRNVATAGARQAADWLGHAMHRLPVNIGQDELVPTSGTVA